MTTNTRRIILAGVLAGICGVLVLMVLSAIMLSIGLFWQIAFLRNLPVIGELAASGVQDNMSRVPIFFWGWRWPLALAIVISIPLAVLDRLAQRYPSPLRERLAAAILLAVLGLLITTGLLIQSDQTLYAVDDVTGSLPTLAERQSSVWNVIIVALPVALGAGGAVWLYWSWWFAHWQTWLGLQTQPITPEAASPDIWLARRVARERMQRVVLGLLGASLLVLIGALQLYQQVQTTIQSGILWATTDAPRAELRLALEQPQRRLILENTFGTGTVQVSLLGPDGASVIPPQQVTFAGARIGNDRTALAVEGLPPGAYLLQAQLQQGEGGQVGYALVQGSPSAHLAGALLVGLAVGLVLALAVLFVSVYVQRVTGV